MILDLEFDRMKPAPARPQQPTAATTTKNVMDRNLEKAAEDGDVECFITILEENSGLLLNSKNHEGNTYLHVAAMHGRCELISRLMTVSGFHKLFTQTNNEGDNALHTAVKAGHFAVTDLLLKRGKESLTRLFTENEEGNLPLHEALLHNHQHLIDLLLHWDKYSSFHVNNKGKSAIYLSVETGDVKSFNAMFKAEGWKYTDFEGLLEKSLMKGKSLFHAAISNKDKVMIQEILVKGLHMLLHVKDENGKSPIEFASTIGFEEGEDILCDELRKDTTDTGDIGVTLQLVGDDSDYIGISRMGRFQHGRMGGFQHGSRDERMRKLLSPQEEEQQQQGMYHHCMDLGLYEAAEKGDVDEFISALEQYSVKQNIGLTTIVSQLTPLKNTFLHVASIYGHKDLSLLIIQYFPNLIDRVNTHGNTSLHLAARHGKLDVIKILEKHSWQHITDSIYAKKCMQMVVENDDGITPLQIAHNHNKKQVVEFFIEEHVEEAYHVNKKGSSLLYTSILDGKTERVNNIFNTESFIVDQNVLDDQLIRGKSLLLAAIWSQKIEMLQELARQKPVLFKVKDEHAQKLVHFAEYMGFHEGANYLQSEFKLEIVLDSIGAVSLPLHYSYSLDIYSLSVIEMVDPRIENIRQSMQLNGRHQRMEKLLCNDSLQQISQKNQKKQSMDVRLYEAAKKGDVDSFIGALEEVSETNNLSPQTISEQRTHIGNTILHVAASHGNGDLVSFIVFYFRHLLWWANSKHFTANHEAARAGHLGVVDILVRFRNYHLQLDSSKEYNTHGLVSISKIFRRRKRIYGSNTSLHEAFVNNRRHVIDYLVESSVEEAYRVNKEGMSGLYLAVEAGMGDVVKTILTSITSDVNQKFISELTGGKSLINAAIKRRSTVMLQEIARKIPAQIHVTDEGGQNPLFYAVSTGFLEGLNCLLDEFKMDTNKMDSTGFYPVHVASESGHVHILEKLMQNVPDAGRFKNRNGQNILHVAAIYGKENIVWFILQNSDLEVLINEKDNNGNTPLHLATINWHPKIVSCLTWDHRVNLTLVNQDGLTALDVAEECMEPTTSFQKRLTWAALMSAGVPRATAKDRISSKKPNSSERNERYNVDYSKDRVNTLLLVATLVATVTFAAGFTMPGGYNNSEPNLGQATLLRKHMLQTFVMCDTIALFSAIMVAVTLIWAQLGDLTLVLNALRFALPLLGLSLTTMSIAFIAGVSLVVANLTWLANFILIFGIISLASVMALFIPLIFSYSSTSPVLRYITYYLFQLLVLASQSSDDTKRGS